MRSAPHPELGFLFVTTMKDAYYFPHDSNAKDDPKMIMLIEELGMEGYGIFWMLIETLRDQADYKASFVILPALARRYNTTPEKVKTVITRYGLFVIEDDIFFYSDSLNRRMQALADKRLKRQLAGSKGGKNKAMLKQNSSNATAMLEQSSSSKVNYSKVKESKEENSIDSRIKAFPKHSKDDAMVQMFIDAGSNAQEAERFFNHYDSQGWLKSNNLPIMDWRSAASNWINRSLHDPRYRVKIEKEVKWPDLSHLYEED
jgi:hypothetical protein